jgi:hypothetical protein
MGPIRTDANMVARCSRIAHLFALLDRLFIVAFHRFIHCAMYQNQHRSLTSCIDILDPKAN